MRSPAPDTEVDAVKRIVTGVRSDGRSYLVATHEFAADEPWKFEFDPHGDVEKWLAGVDPVMADASAAITPSAPGGINLHYTVIKPHQRHSGDRPHPGLDSEGRHVTRTIDFGVVLGGEIELILDEDTVVLQPGDFVIQQATRHAWNNVQAVPATLAFVLVRPAYVR
jgi:hypothetical protein